MKYDDLLFAQYREGGRDAKTGLDCYGLVLELCRRAKTPLIDIAKHNTEGYEKPNLTEVTDFKAGDIIETAENGILHVGYLLSKSRVIHATEQGVLISSVLIFHNPKFYRVVPLCK